MTKLSARLPEGDANGLSAISAALIDQPHAVHVVIALVDCKSITTDHDTGDVRPTARIRRIEPVRGDKEMVAKIMRRAMEERTGRTVLPFDLEEDMRAAFEGIDPSTGEILD